MDTRLETKAKDTKKFRGQEQECSRPRPRAKDTDASFFQKTRSSKFFFRRSQKKGLQKIFSGEKVFKNFFSCDLYLRKPKKRSLQIFRKVSSVFQRNFSGSKIVLSSSRGQGKFRRLEASRPRPRTSKCVLEAKYVLEDSTSENYHQSYFFWKRSVITVKITKKVIRYYSNSLMPTTAYWEV